MQNFATWLENRDYIFASSIFEAEEILATPERETSYIMNGIKYTKLCRKCARKIDPNLPAELKPEKVQKGQRGEGSPIDAYKKRVYSGGTCEVCDENKMQRQKELAQQRKDRQELYSGGGSRGHAVNGKVYRSTRGLGG